MEFQKLRVAFVLLLCTIGFGTTGYYIFENMKPFDAFYMSMITINTVGFQEVKPLTIIMMDSELGLAMEELKVGHNSSMVRKTLVESNLRRDYGVIIVAIKKINGQMIFNPQSSEILDAGDVIVALGKKYLMEQMSKVL